MHHSHHHHQAGSVGIILSLLYLLEVGDFLVGSLSFSTLSNNMPSNKKTKKPVASQKTKGPSKKRSTKTNSWATTTTTGGSGSGNNNNTTTTTTTTNEGYQPTNILIQNTAHLPLEYTFVLPQTRQKHYNLIIHQQNTHDETWPGGALWDLGFVMASFLVAVASSGGGRSGGGGKTTATSSTTTTTTTCTLQTLLPSSSSSSDSYKIRRFPITVPTRFHTLLEQPQNAWLRAIFPSLSTTTTTGHHQQRWVELGCGVGLTGLAAAAAFQPRAVLLTDLVPVIQHVTQPNVQANVRQICCPGGSSNNNKKKHHNNTAIATTDCLAVPLCWGNDEDIQVVRDLLKSWYKPPSTAISSSSLRRRRNPKKGSSSSGTTTKPKLDDTGTDSPPLLVADSEEDHHHRIEPAECADVILIGDVAYQHKPGAPSHFDVLHSTLLQLCHNDTLVIFGTRLRMPASQDLVDLLLQDFDPILDPPLRVDEIDPTSFGNMKHNMSIHFLRRIKSQNTQGCAC
jgi:predicted nicotinamide N-methyase